MMGPHGRVRTIIYSGLVVSSCLLSTASGVLAAATESSRDRTTVTADKNTITADNNIRFTRYEPGENLTITKGFSSL